MPPPVNLTTVNLTLQQVQDVANGEYIAGAVAWSLTKVLIGWSLMMTFAWAVFDFGALEIGHGFAVACGIDVHPHVVRTEPERRLGGLLRRFGGWFDWHD